MKEDSNGPGMKEIVYWKGQGEAISSLAKALENHRAVFLDAPTGSGKSLINLSIAQRLGTGYITTPQVTLVNQYNRDVVPGGSFAGLGSAVMGRKNYPCPYAIKLKQISDLKFPLNHRLVKGINSRSPRIRELSLTAALAPCTADSPSFVGNLDGLLQAAMGGKGEGGNGFFTSDGKLRSGNRGGKEREEPKPEMVKDCPFWNETTRTCPYYSARDRAMEDGVAVTTFHYFEYGVLNGIKRYEKDAVKKDTGIMDGEDGLPSFEWNPPPMGGTVSRPAWKRRGVLIIDEAHNLPDFLVNFYTIQASSRWPRFDFKAFLEEVEKARDGNPDDVSNKTFEVFRKWFRGYCTQEENRLKSLKDGQKDMENRIEMNAKIRTGSIEYTVPTVVIKDYAYGADGSVETRPEPEYTQDALYEEIEKQKEMVYNLGFRKDTLESEVEWIYSPPAPGSSPQRSLRDLDGNGGAGDGEWVVSWKPYEAAPLLAGLWSMFPKVVFSSATFLDVPVFLKRLGLDPGDADVVTVDSTFPADSSPIFFPLNRYIGKRYLQPDGKDDLAVVVREIERIAALPVYRNEKGVVHFPSYEWFRAVYGSISPELKERAIVHSSSTRNDVLDEFKASEEPAVLFAIKMEEGTDFKDGQARWQILVKTPYQDLRDEWVSRHKDKMGQRWYEMSALQQVIQASGRIMRNDRDWGDTYVLDRNALMLIRKYRSECPDWFLERIVHPE